VYVGEQLGWYAALAEQPRTPAELAAATGTNERYAREWLEHQAAGGFVTVADGRYELPPEQAEELLDEESLLYTAPLSETPSAATGTVMRPETMRRYAQEARFDDAVVLDIEHDAFRFYRLN
jgi:hypothetical protein